MERAGFSCAFNDVEGELLFLLVREFRPELVYEISPNSGFSTNYLLAAVTRNGTGRIEGFELIPEFFGRPSDAVIRGHFLEVCDPARYRLHVGDARRTVPVRLQSETPDFVLIDSCHEDFFAEFYVKELLPRCRGIAFVQDIAHFDPRAEHTTEAYYVLSFFHETGSRFLLTGAYEDGLNRAGVRERLRPRRPFRSNSVIVALPEPALERAPPNATLAELVPTGNGAFSPPPWSERFGSYPLNAALVFPDCLAALPLDGEDRPEDDYVRAWYQGKIGQARPLLGELIALSAGKCRLSETQERNLVGAFAQYDPFGQVLILEALVREGRASVAGRLLEQVHADAIRGAELPCRLARVALRVGHKESACRWLDRSRQAVEPAQVIGYRTLLDCAELYLGAGERGRARQAFRSALEHIGQRAEGSRGKSSRAVFSFCLRHPGFWPFQRRVRLQHGEWLYALADVGRNLARRFVPTGIVKWLRRRVA